MKLVALLALLISVACSSPQATPPRARPLLPLTKPELVSGDKPCTGEHCDFWNRVRQQVHNHWHPAMELKQRDPNAVVYGKADRVTILRVTTDATGKIENIVVTTSCGLDFLDAEAVRAFREMAPLRNPPRALISTDGLMTFDYRLTFSFRERKAEPQLKRVWTNGESEQKKTDAAVQGYIKRFYHRMLSATAADLRTRDIKEPVVMQALLQVRFTLRIDGEVVDATVLRSSGSRLFDDVLVKALRGAGAGATDPPPDVLFNENGHFIGLFSYRDESKHTDVDFAESPEAFLSRVERRIGTGWPPASIVAAYRPNPSSRRHFVIAHLVLDRTGKLLGRWITASSGEQDIDETALEVIRQTAPFDNPPQSLVGPDGLIRFDTELFL